MQIRTHVLTTFITLVVLCVGSSLVFAQEMSCTDCHNDSTIITGKQTAMSEAVHGTGEAYVRGSRADCAGCHSGGAFSKMVAAGLRPDQVEEGDPEPTRQDCRTCHAIHTNYTVDDWILETTASVDLYAFDSVTYDGGKGNLCANCHQPRRALAAPDTDGNIRVTSTHWGPHHGPQSAMMLGVGGSVTGQAGVHSAIVENTCVSCHIGKGSSHTFEAILASCQECHPDDKDFDHKGVQTQVAALADEVRDLLLAKGLLSEDTEWQINEDGNIEKVVVGYHPVVGTYPAAQAAALWDYIFIVIEDGSFGVHNYKYTIALLETAKAALQ